MNMRVLVTEDELGGSKNAVVELTAAGHQVVTCQPPGATVHPCVGLAGGECPLEQHVDVAVVVHSGHTGHALTGREFGAVCAAGETRPSTASWSLRCATRSQRTDCLCRPTRSPSNTPMVPRRTTSSSSSPNRSVIALAASSSRGSVT